MAKMCNPKAALKCAQYQHGWWAAHYAAVQAEIAAGTYVAQNTAAIPGIEAKLQSYWAEVTSFQAQVDAMAAA